MTFPWRRGDGHFMLSASMPLILQPIVKKLREDRELSKVLSEFLWLRYGDPNIEETEGELAILETQQRAIKKRMKELRTEQKVSVELQTKQNRLEELNNDITKFRPAYNRFKNGRKWKYEIDPRFKHHQLICEEAFNTYQSESAFILAFQEWEEEKERLILQIGQGVKKKL